jgi:PST family polysaccharide transporter
VTAIITTATTASTTNRSKILSNSHSAAWLRSAAFLSVIQLANQLIPLVSIPYLASVLGPAGWGRLAVAQSFGLYLTTILEYGFNLSATREIAGNPRDAGRIAGRVLSAQAGLYLVGALCTVLVLPRFSIFREDSLLILSTLIWVIPQGISLQWLFQGLDRLPLLALATLCARFLGLAGLFAFVRAPGDLALAQMVQAVPALLLLSAAAVVLLRETGLSRPAIAEVWTTLRSSFLLFVYRAGLNVHAAAMAFLLGCVAAPEVVGYYAAAERVAKAALSFLDPLTLTLFPRLTALAAGQRNRLAWRGTGALFLAGTLLGAALFIGAPYLVPFLLGERFRPAIDVLRILAALGPLSGLSQALGPTWLLAERGDSLFLTVVLSVAASVLMLLLVIEPQAQGMAWLMVLTQGLLALGFAGALRLKASR